MKKPTINHIISIVEEKIAPPFLALPDDRIGLQVGRENEVVNGILLCIDVTKEIINEAKEKGANLILAHHPLIFNPLTHLNFSNPSSGIIREAIKNDISIYIAHTNLDAAPGGVNDCLVKVLKEELDIKKEESLLILKNKEKFPLGKMVELRERKMLKEIVLGVEKTLKPTYIKVGGVKNEGISKVALCGGSCKDLVYPAYKRGAELFITGELGHHSCLEAKFLGLSVIEAGHFETEAVVLPFLKEKIQKQLEQKDWQESICIFISEICTSPYFILS